MYVVGLMSGTSADGIDAALVEITGAPPTLQVQLIAHSTHDYDPALRSAIFACFRPESSGVDQLSRLNAALGEAYAAAVLETIRAANFASDQVDLVASHGQTVWYDAPDGLRKGNVLALGEPAIIAERTGITTISGFRSRDLAVGGRGAPLVSYLDWLLFRHPTQARVIQNIGGIGNLTALPPLSSDQAPSAFDTGPGNMIIDYCVQRATDGALPYDRNGQIAAGGRIDQTLLAELLAHPYITQTPPKTTGRELFGVQFGAEVWARGESLNLSSDDVIATVTAFTAESIAYACRAFIPYQVDALYVAGGGARNPTLCSMLAERITPTVLHVHDELGIPANAKECVLFALLGYETWHGRSGTLPIFTGAEHPTVLGSITPGRSWPR